MKRRFCIITCTYNAADELPRTLKSVQGQDYEYITHLIKDGASKDNTMELVRTYEAKCSLTDNKHEIIIVSEKDTGLYDAMNTSIELSKGDYLVFLNAGDSLPSPTTISEIANQLDQYDDANLPAVIYGNTNIINDQGHIQGLRRLQPPETLTWRSFIDGMLVCHQSFYARIDIAKHVLYNTHYRFSADVDWCIRIMKAGAQKGLVNHNSKMILSNFLDGGMTTRNHRASLIERFEVMRKHYGLIATLIAHAKFFMRNSKIK